MIVDEVHQVISRRQSRWLEKYKNFNTRKINEALKDFEKDFQEFIENALYWKTRENVRKRLKVKFVQKDVVKKILQDNQN